ncbi:MAG: acyl carrier protein [Chitinophagales bacterium]|nr:acyl carrier protein [Chitinophagales bacterium]MCZ2393991.1 acyl carrier protein [Chitinophagales bacterium]
MSTIAERVKNIIIERLNVEESKITNEANFIRDLGADSLDTVELIMEFENEFKVSIPDEEAENINTVGDVISYLESNVSI